MLSIIDATTGRETLPGTGPQQPEPQPEPQPTPGDDRR
jgi:hypothetical protein